MSQNDAIKQAVLNYVEGWYTGDGERMNQALSQYLAKRRITPENELMEVSKEWMVRETGNGIGKIENPSVGRKDIRILAQTSTIATVELLSETFVDYLHLVKIGDHWEIANALWDYHEA